MEVVDRGLTECEQQVMKCIWDTRADMSLQQITVLVNERYGKTWKPQTVSTFLSRLVKKEYLEMYRKGRQFFYHPHIMEQTYKARSIADCVKFWCGDDAGELLAVLKQTRGLRENEIKKIREMIR
ncbi:MAG: BlaI/MecI/CopY family transcriptional regulator [Clostridiales bacterium]|nr:BlaI/MecI/CopY family transcriptional regulator [Clostridiales bacterium]